MNLIDLKKNPELIPVIEWWEKDGKQTVICVLVAVAAVAGWYGWKHHRASERAAASAAIAEATAPADLEEAVAKFSGSAAEPALEIKLAKSYYDDGRYDEALARYEEMSGKVPPEFADIPVVGKAMCLEALKKFPEALEAFDGFVEANPKSYLALTAKLGAARCVAESGDSAKALERIEALKKECEGDDAAKSRVEAAENAIKRLAKEPKE